MQEERATSWVEEKKHGVVFGQLRKYRREEKLLGGKDPQNKTNSLVGEKLNIFLSWGGTKFRHFLTRSDRGGKDNKKLRVFAGETLRFTYTCVDYCVKNYRIKKINYRGERGKKGGSSSRK